MGGSISHAIAETSDNDWDAEGYKHNDGEHNEDELSECKYGEGDHEYSENEHGEHDDEDEHGYEDYNAAGYEYEDYSMAGDECYNPVSNDDRDRVGGEEVEAKGECIKVSVTDIVEAMMIQGLGLGLGIAVLTTATIPQWTTSHLKSAIQMMKVSATTDL